MLRHRDGWHETKLMSVEALGSADRVYLADARSKNRFEDQLRFSPGYEKLKDREVLWIADGAPWIWNMKRRLCPHAHELLDYYYSGIKTLDKRLALYYTQGMKHRDARKLSQKEQRELRHRAVRMLESGLSHQKVAEMLEVSRTTVTAWWGVYRREGLDGLDIKKRGRMLGDKRRLTPEQERRIQKLIVDKTPDQLKMPFALWTRKAIGLLIEQEYGVKLPVRTMGLYLKRWGFTPQKPIRKAYEQQPEVVKRWLDEEYPEVKKRAKREGATILWGDETGVSSSDHRGRGLRTHGLQTDSPRSGKKVFDEHGVDDHEPGRNAVYGLRGRNERRHFPAFSSPPDPGCRSKNRTDSGQPTCASCEKSASVGGETCQGDGTGFPPVVLAGVEPGRIAQPGRETEYEFPGSNERKRGATKETAFLSEKPPT